jgi:hypothetical protein
MPTCQYTHVGHCLRYSHRRRQFDDGIRLGFSLGVGSVSYTILYPSLHYILKLIPQRILDSKETM